MAGNKLKFFNKYINIEFLDEEKNPLASITCPKFGRKPDIEINAEINAADAFAAMHITIRSLYLSTIGSEIKRARVTAGFQDGDKATFYGSVTEMYQSEPGPDAATIMQITEGTVEDWLSKPVTVSVDPGGSLEDALKALSNAVGLDSPQIQGDAAGMKLPAGFSFNGEAREAVQKLKSYCPKAVIIIQENKICATDADNPLPSKIVALDFLSAPPQFIGGDKGVYATITAPWNPAVKIGSAVTFPSKFYESSGMVRKTADKSTVAVDGISLHFSTVKNINKMVVRGAVNSGEEKKNG